MKYRKYHNVPTVVDDIKFDSRREAERYSELKLLLLGGNITNLELQPRFLLQDGFMHAGKKIRKIEYVADFSYIDADTGEHVVEDVKAFDKRTQKYRTTKDFDLKLKLFLFRYGQTYVFRFSGQ